VIILSTHPGILEELPIREGVVIEFSQERWLASQGGMKEAGRLQQSRAPKSDEAYE
jgi:hypothetical protein